MLRSSRSLRSLSAVVCSAKQFDPVRGRVSSVKEEVEKETQHAGGGALWYGYL